MGAVGIEPTTFAMLAPLDLNMGSTGFEPVTTAMLAPLQFRPMDTAGIEPAAFAM